MFSGTIRPGQIRKLFLVRGRVVRFAIKKRGGWSKSGIQRLDRLFIMEGGRICKYKLKKRMLLEGGIIISAGPETRHFYFLA